MKRWHVVVETSIGGDPHTLGHSQADLLRDKDEAVNVVKEVDRGDEVNIEEANTVEEVILDDIVDS